MFYVSSNCSLHALVLHFHFLLHLALSYHVIRLSLCCLIGYNCTPYHSQAAAGEVASILLSLTGTAHHTLGSIVPAASPACPTLPCTALPYPALPCPVLPCPTKAICPALSGTALPCLDLSYPDLPSPLPCLALPCHVLTCFALLRSASYCLALPYLALLCLALP